MRFRILLLCAALLLTFKSVCIAAQTVALSDDPDFIRASLLISSPGESPQSFSGHAALRLQCPEQNLDAVFTFENNNADNFTKLILQGAQGRIFEVNFDKYINDFRKEGRGTNEYALNLSLNEKARLWEVFDSLKMLPDRPFDKDTHCFSSLAEAIDIAVYPAHVNWNENSLAGNSYGKDLWLVHGQKSPWHYVFITLPLGEMADVPGEGRWFVYPSGFEMTYDQYRIVAPDGSVRNLINGSPKEVLPEIKEDKPTHPTPLESALILLGIVVIITAVQFFGYWNTVGKVLDISLWILATGVGIIILIATYAPGHFGASWNWPLIVFNPFAWIPVVILNKNKKIMVRLWTVYAVVLILFAVFIGFISPSIDIMWRIAAVAFAIRCLWHIYTLTLQKRKQLV